MDENSHSPGTAPGDTVDARTRRRVVVASFIGNFVEWFDYAVYGYLAVTIARVFFPDADPQAGLLSTFALFAISFLVRPLGGFFWGGLGDRIGRKNALAASILIMSAATFCIGLLPGYAQVGIWAPILLLLIRLVQGFSAAGEYAGSSAFLTEYAPAGRRGRYASVVPASTAAGLLLGSLAPHLVRAQPFLWPLKTPVIERIYSAAGVGLYDALAYFGARGRRTVPFHAHLSKKSAKKLFPDVRGDALVGAIRFYDARVDDARLVLALVRTAARYGALAANRARATGLITDRAGKVAGALVRDEETGTTHQGRAGTTIAASAVDGFGSGATLGATVIC